MLCPTDIGGSFMHWSPMLAGHGVATGLHLIPPFRSPPVAAVELVLSLFAPLSSVFCQFNNGNKILMLYPRLNFTRLFLPSRPTSEALLFGFEGRLLACRSCWPGVVIKLIKLIKFLFHNFGLLILFAPLMSLYKSSFRLVASFGLGVIS